MSPTSAAAAAAAAAAEEAAASGRAHRRQPTEADLARIANRVVASAAGEAGAAWLLPPPLDPAEEAAREVRRAAAEARRAAEEVRVRVRAQSR